MSKLIESWTSIAVNWFAIFNALSVVTMITTLDLKRWTRPVTNRVCAGAFVRGRRYPIEKDKSLALVLGVSVEGRG